MGIVQAEFGADRSPAWRRRKDQRRPEILEAARSLLEEVGGERASLGEIARRASVSEATVYKYFENKQDLVWQVIEAWMEPSLDRLERELPVIGGTESRLWLLAVRHLREMQLAPGLHRLVYSELRWADYRGSALHRMNQRYSRIVEWIFLEGIKQGDICGDIDPKLARDMLFGSLEHVGWRMVFGGQPIEIEDASKHLVERILSGIAPQPRKPTDDTAQAVLVARLERAIAQLETQSTSQNPE